MVSTRADILDEYVVAAISGKALNGSFFPAGKRA
jgi:hypothetical protein